MTISNNQQVTNVVDLNNVSFSWSKDAEPTLEIKHLSIPKAHHTFIKGPSGCGKSTLLSLLTGINSAQQGQVEVLGTDLTQLSSRHRDRFRADYIGYIFQQFNLLPYLSVVENVVLPCQFSSLRKKNVTTNLDDKAKELLDRLHLSKTLLNKPVIELSIGQQQRVAAARALMGDPKIIIADEPTSALDFDNRTAFIELLMDQATQAEATLVFVSHDPTLEPLFKRSIQLQEINTAGGHL
ncbi:ABC transporter ATP-binding protein [Vibrio agarivorans]|uniref:ABC transporter ATP-binding protein n=1 Tax=Vibrio agarivorans TaxID=153622 RepID=A0ABT7Y2A6_9VIBR|nr:ABC transporter ATP-binding protein [Vibrio agarivorans]MDN2482181.1 ABC transporter ATP-binding protein [Vibrio agarivorans]